jgi:hypothetical protein
MKRVFFGKVKEGKLEMERRDLMTQFISTMKDMDVEVIIQSVTQDPSLRQWGYLYGSVYTEFGTHFGWTVDAVDKWMKERFMEENGIVLPDGLLLTKTCFDRAWLAKYVDSCLRYAAEQGVVCMPPKIEA